MATVKPLVLQAGEYQELQPGDTIPLTSLGIQTVKAPTGNVLTTALTSLVVTWPQPWPDLLYSCQATCEASGLNILEVQGIISRTTTTVTFSIKNLSLSTVSGTIHVLGIKDS